MTNSKDLTVKYKGKVIDVSGFRKNHPGGSKLLEPYNGKEVENVMQAINHGKMAYKILDNMDPETIENDLVDWSKPLADQVPKLGKKYWDWVQEPILHDFRMFDNEYIETIITTTWQISLASWTPIIIVFLLGSYHRIAVAHYPDPDDHWKVLGQMVLYFGLGLGMWPFFEYILHRYIFHVKLPESTLSSERLIYLHFNFHGSHHKAPHNRRKLLFPPIPAAGFVSVFYFFYYHAFGPGVAEAVLVGTLVGYLGYDLTHYYLHHGSPKPGSYMYNMKRYHNKHHFIDENIGFGVSSTIFDKIFNTEIKLPKPKCDLVWE